MPQLRDFDVPESRPSFWVHVFLLKACFSSAYGGCGEVSYSSVAFCTLWFLSSCYINHNTKRTLIRRNMSQKIQLTTEPRNAVGWLCIWKCMHRLACSRKPHSMVSVQLKPFIFRSLQPGALAISASRQPFRKVHFFRTCGAQINSPWSKSCHSGNPRSEAKVKSRGGFLCMCAGSVCVALFLPEVPDWSSRQSLRWRPDSRGS